MTRILLVEDEVVLREEVASWLRLEGYETIEAGDGQTAVEIALREPVDLIISDITMPGLDGYGMLLELNSHPSTMHIPFIFVTARATYEDVRKGMDSGADDYITKPFTHPELLQAVQTRLIKKASQHEKFRHEIDQWHHAFEHEREQRQLRSKLVAMFSHDFRNPLSSILSSNSLLRDYWSRMDDEKRIAHFNSIEASARQLLQMLDDLLVVSQIESGSLAYKPQMINIGSFFQRIIEDFQSIHRETHQIVYENPQNLVVMADERLLRQIATNLISNAIKYSPPGTIGVALVQQENSLIFSVQDNGIGIPEADQERLFSAFQRASNVGDVAGTGLGLAIVKEAAELHGGTIDLKSKQGVGTIIRVRFPLVLTG
jgi:two-component system, sensor histidine kinase and response regulator